MRIASASCCSSISSSTKAGGTHVALPVLTTSHVAPVDVAYAAIALVAAIALAALGLFGRPWRERLPAGIRDPARGVVRQARRLHSGHIGDYITWWTAGAGALGGVCLIALR